MQVLIAEDDPMSRRLLEGTLHKWGYDVLSVTDGRAAWDVLASPDSPCLAVLDWMIPEIDGLELCRRVRQAQPGKPYVYLILLTSRTERSDMIAGMNAGADDYITKPFDAAELHVRLHAAGRILDLQSRLLATQEALRQQATHDPLTGVFNRGAVVEGLARELSRAQRAGISVGVGLADLDHFKTINDTLGHSVGDVVLAQAAQRMAGAMRPYDILGRYGGEEFLVIAPTCQPHQTLEVAQRLCRAIGQTPFEVQDRHIAVTMSMGVVTVGPDECANPDEIIARADAAMYTAKTNGRNRVEVAPVLAAVPT